MSRRRPAQHRIAVPTAYGDDLAYVHDAGFGDFARHAAAAVLPWLRRAGIQSGLVIDLGCGTGIFATELLRAGYCVLGVDLSESMLKLARRRAPQAKFVNDSLFRVRLPRCDAVTAIGECLNYTFDHSNSARALSRLFRRVCAALRPGGMFIFDMAGPGSTVSAPDARHWTDGEDWAVLVERNKDRKTGLLTRRIISFRQVGARYRRSEETHALRLYGVREITRELRAAGFTIRVLRSYGVFRLPPAHFVIQAQKPSRSVKRFPGREH